MSSRKDSRVTQSGKSGKSNKSTNTQNRMNTKWSDQVRVVPNRRLLLQPNRASKVQLLNRSKVRLTFKLKTNRQESVRPDRIYGVLNPNSGAATLRIGFVPKKGEAKLKDKDRLTILMKPLGPNDRPTEFESEKSHTVGSDGGNSKRLQQNLEKIWNKKQEGSVYRFVLRLIDKHSKRSKRH